MSLRLSSLLGVAGLTLASTSAVWAAPDMPSFFSDAERAGVMTYWNAPGRYTVVSPGSRQDLKESGPFVARLTPEASIWFHDYARAIKPGVVPPTENAQATTPLGQSWDAWVDTKVKYDRAVAQQQADAANAQLVTAINTGAGVPPMGAAAVTTMPATAPAPTGPLTPLPQALAPFTTPPLLPVPLSAQTNAEPLPPAPGPIPATLLAAVGNPPAFSACVAPLRHRIQFDTGEVITYNDYIGFKNQRFAYFRFAQGIASGGTKLSTLPPGDLDRIFAAGNMTPFEGHVMRGVSLLEGGFDSINTYDTGYLSVGFIQFATLGDGAGSLGAVVRYEKRNSPQDFARDFHAYGVDVTEGGAIVVVDPSTGAELVGGDAVRKVIDDKRLAAVFHLAGIRSIAFRSAQIYTAKDSYYPANLTVSVALNGQTLTGKVGDVIHSEAGMATLFDRKVNTGNLGKLNDVLAQVMTAHNLTTLDAVTPYEREVVAALKYRTDFLKDTNLTQPQ